MRLVRSLVSKWLVPIAVIAIAVNTIQCTNQNEMGSRVYAEYCSGCHGDSGEGLRGLIPPIAGADYMLQNEDQLICIIRYGMEGPIQVNGREYDQPMAGITQLTSIEIANLINYFAAEMVPGLRTITVQEVEAKIDECREQQ